MENEQTPKIINQSLNIDPYSTFLEPLSKSLNYEYLGSLIEETVEEIPILVLEEIKSVSKKGNKFIEKKQKNLESFSPENMNINEYCKELQTIYNRKIKIECEIKNLGENYQKEEISFSYLSKKGEDLIKEAINLEPFFFAITELPKKHIDSEIKKIIENYGSYLSENEISLLSTPLITDFFTRRYLDVQDFLKNPSKEKESLLKIRYGKFLFNKKWYKNQKFDYINNEKLIRKDKKRFSEKYYLLLERKIPNIEKIDYLLMMDNTIDKHIQANFAFLHDIFLKMQMLYGDEKISNIMDKNKIKSLISESIRDILKDINQA